MSCFLNHVSETWERLFLGKGVFESGYPREGSSVGPHHPGLTQGRRLVFAVLPRHHRLEEPSLVATPSPHDWLAPR